MEREERLAFAIDEHGLTRRQGTPGGELDLAELAPVRRRAHREPRGLRRAGIVGYRERDDQARARPERAGELERARDLRDALVEDLLDRGARAGRAVRDRLRLSHHEELVEELRELR